MLDWLPTHKASLSLEHNEHKSSYESIEEWTAFLGLSDDEWASPGEKEKAIREDSLWMLQWYPETPIGFHRIAASSIEAIRERVLADRGNSFLSASPGHKLELASHAIVNGEALPLVKPEGIENHRFVTLTVHSDRVELKPYDGQVSPG